MPPVAVMLPLKGELRVALVADRERFRLAVVETTVKDLVAVPPPSVTVTVLLPAVVDNETGTLSWVLLIYAPVWVMSTVLPSIWTVVEALTPVKLP